MELIVSQEKLEQNRKNALLKEATKQNYAEQDKLRNICLFMTMMTIIIFALAMVVCINANLKKKGYENCLEQGYDVNYCLKHS
jgi:hypothetical protein